MTVSYTHLFSSSTADKSGFDDMLGDVTYEMVSLEEPVPGLLHAVFDVKNFYFADRIDRYLLFERGKQGLFIDLGHPQLTGTEHLDACLLYTSKPMEDADARHETTRVIQNAQNIVICFNAMDGKNLAAVLCACICEDVYKRQVEGLAFGIFLAHEHFAFHVHQRRCCSRGNTVLTCARFSNNARFTHLLGKQNLPEHVIDLMRTGVVQVFTLQVDLCATQRLSLIHI